MKTCVNKNVKDYDKVINFLLLLFQSEQCNFFNDLVIYVQNQIGEWSENICFLNCSFINIYVYLKVAF